MLEDGPHLPRGAEVSRVARVEKVRIERRAPALALFLEHVAQVVRQRLNIERRDARPLQHGHLLHLRLFYCFGDPWRRPCPRHAKLDGLVLQDPLLAKTSVASRSPGNAGIELLAR